MARQYPSSDLANVLATLAPCPDDMPCHTQPKLPRGGGPPDPWMLAALVFDLYRKTGYMYKALRVVEGTPDAQLFREIVADDHAIDEAGREGSGSCNYQRIAEVAHQIMMRLHSEIHDERQQRLRAGAAGP